MSASKSRLTPLAAEIGLSPVAQEFESILHRVGVERVSQAQQSAYNIAYRSLLRNDDASVMLGTTHPIYVPADAHEI